MQEYPKWVTPDRDAWLKAETPEARRAAKVLVQNEAAHRLVAPADFVVVSAAPREPTPDWHEKCCDDDATDVPEAPAPVPMRRGPGRPRKVVE